MTTKLSPPPTIEFPLVMTVQIKEPTSLWKKIVFLAKAHNWTTREVIEHAISVIYHLYEAEHMQKLSVRKEKQNLG